MDHGCRHETQTVVDVQMYSATAGRVLDRHTQEVVHISIFSTQELDPKVLNATALASASNLVKGDATCTLGMLICAGTKRLP